MSASRNGTPCVSELYIYPLKSARGVSLSAVELDWIGPRADRRWMVIGEDGRFLSQRGHPRLALLGVTLHDGGATYRKWDGEVWFGQNAMHGEPGVIRVGDAVSIYSQDTR